MLFITHFTSQLGRYGLYAVVALCCLPLSASAATTTISGTVYSDLGVTAVGSGETVGVAITAPGGIAYEEAVTANGDGYSVAWNGDYVVVGSNWSEIKLYELSGGSLTLLDTANPSGGGEVQGLAWNGDYLAAAHSGGNNLSLFKLNRSTNELDSLTNPNALPDKGWSVAWSGNYLAAGHGNWAGGDGQNLSLYKLDTGTDTLTELTDPTTPDGGVRAVDWSGNYLAVGLDGSMTQKLQWYELDTGTDTLTQLTDPTNVSGAVNSVAWNGDYLAVKSDSGNRLFFYERSGSTLSKLTDPTALPSGSGTWRGDYLSWYGDTLAVGHFGGDNLFLYERDGDNLTKLDDPETQPPANAIAADWNDDGYLLVSHANSSGDNAALYKMSAGSIATGTTMTDGSGSWSIDLGAAAGADQIGVAWVEAGMASSTTVWTDTLSTSTRTTVPLYADTVLVHGTSATTTLANAAVYDNAENNNIRFTATTTAPTSFTAFDTLYVASGTVAQLPTDLELQGGFTKRGTVLGAGTTMTLAGTDQVLDSTSTTTLYGLEKTVTAADTTWFMDGSVWDITDSLDLAGVAGELLTLRSTTSAGAGGAVTWEGMTENSYNPYGADTTPQVMTKPSGTSDTDLLIAIVYGSGSGAVTWPSGWTEIDSSYTGFAGLGVDVYWAWGDVADLTLSQSAPFVVNVHRFSGVNQTTPIRDHAVTSDASATDDQPTGSVTLLAGDGVLASWVAFQNTTAWGSAPSGYTSRNNTADVRSPDTVNGWRLAAVTQDDMAAGATGALSHNQNNAYQWRSELALAIAAGSPTAGDWYIDAPTTNTAAYLDVAHANNLAATAIDCSGCVDSGDNTNWTFSTAQTETISVAETSFYVGQGDLTLPTVTVDQGASPSITSATDIRIQLPSGMPSVAFDTSVSSVTLGGTASGKVSSSVSYEATNTVAVLSVSSDLSADDTLTIDDLALESVPTVGESGALNLFLDSDTTGEPAATTENTIGVTGSITQSDHANGAADNQFSFQNTDEATIFAFSLIVAEEDMSITSTEFLLDGFTAALSNVALYQDNNSDGEYDGGDALVASNGTLLGTTLTFTDTIVATTSHDYILVADVSNVSLGTSLEVGLNDMTVTGVTSERTVTLLGAVNLVEHERGGAGGGGSARVSTQGQLGDEVATSTETITGGSGDGGDSLDPNSGDSLILATGYFAPASTGGTANGWTNGANAYVSNGSYATADSDGLQQSYSDFGISVPSGNEITGVTVKFEANSTAATGTLLVALSWDGGSTFTATQEIETGDATDAIYTLGGVSNTWGRSWSETDFSDANFVLRIESAHPAATTQQLDTIQVRPHHQTSGGSGGGGGALGFWYETWLPQLQLVWDTLQPSQFMANLILSL